MRHPGALAAGFCGKVQFDDFDAIAGLNPAWDERYGQIGKGRPTIRLAFATTGSLQLAYAARAPGVRIQGATAAGISSVGVPLDVRRLHVQGTAWDPGYLGYVPHGVEYEIFGAAPHRVLALAVAHDRLQAAAVEVLGQPLPDVRSGVCLKVRSAEAKAALVRTWSRWVARGVRDPSSLLDPATAGRMEEEVLAAFLGSVVLDLAPRPVRPRRELALRAESFIRDTLGQPVPLGEILRGRPRLFTRRARELQGGLRDPAQGLPEGAPPLGRPPGPAQAAPGHHGLGGCGALGLLPVRLLRRRLPEDVRREPPRHPSSRPDGPTGAPGPSRNGSGLRDGGPADAPTGYPDPATRGWPHVK